MGMYTKDLKHKMTLRLNDELYEFVNEMSEMFMLSPSDYIRQCIAQNKDARKMALDLLNGVKEKASNMLEEGLENGIDRKTDKHNIV